MKELLSIEFKRLFKGHGIKISLFIGIFISIYHYINNVIPLRESLDLSKKFIEQYGDKNVNTVRNVFTSWLGVDVSTQESFAFYLIFPLLAVIPYGFTLFSDRNNGFIKSIYFRSERKHYLSAKYLVGFITGFVVVTLPLILNFILTLATLPDLSPEWVDSPLVNSTTLFYNLYDSSPYLYTFIYLIILGVTGGLYATLGLVITNFVKLKVSTMIFPFILHVFLYSLADLIGNYRLSPLCLVNGATNGNSPMVYKVNVPAEKRVRKLNSD